MRRADHSSREVLPTVVRLLCDLEISRMRRPWPALGCSTMGKNKFVFYITFICNILLFLNILFVYNALLHVPVAARSKA